MEFTKEEVALLRTALYLLANQVAGTFYIGSATEDEVTAKLLALKKLSNKFDRYQAEEE
ncbi:hypothetical protein H1164_03770 [Thermoactinomyces daqus]|uniref:Uncharacterized protein n=1 Tax=Thermoactinomyces daqus TaxID=1329516 RepID=A0A7W1X8N9_9BACL|nr:hypothetical protein [Thermoactinomyces daqus]MBA4542019.1 hypothetical protein [Thermoactinomyces daqus]